MKREALLGAVGSLLLAFGCGVDGRSLSYEVNALGSAPGHAGSDAAGDAANPRGGVSGTAGDTGGGSAAAAAGGSGSLAGQAGQAPSPQGGRDAMNEAGSAGQGSTTSAAGDASGGVAGLPEPDPFPCGDLNLDAVDDCGQSLVRNPSFDQNSTGWVSEGSLIQAWLQEDARGSGASGSLSLANGNVVAGATGQTGLASHQCLFAWSGDTLTTSARVHIAAQPGAGQAGINLTFFGGDECEGALLGGEDLAFTATTGKWVRVSGKLVVPPGTRSARVRLMVEKPFDAPSVEARFDDVVVLEL